MSEKYNKIKKKISEEFELPTELVLDVSKLIIIGTDSITIENHKGVLDYCENKVGINAGNYYVVINGSNLIIKSIVQDEIAVKGKIKSIDFLVR